MKNATEIKQLMTSLNYMQEQYAERKADLLAKLSENVVYQMPWVTEELFIASFKLSVYNMIPHIGNVLTQNVDEICISQKVQWKIADLELHVSREYNVRENSSGSMHREVSTWKFIASMQLIKELKGLVA
jgi:hypothetical protein